MAPTLSVIFLLFLPLITASDSIIFFPKSKVPKVDKDLIEFSLNLEYLEAEFFLYGSMGKGLDQIEPNLTGGGPKPIGVRIANLTPFVRNIIAQFAFQEVGHIRKIKSIVPGFPRPMLNLSVLTFTEAVNKAFKGNPLFPLFDPYANDINYLLSAYMIPYIGLTSLVGANPKLQTSTSKELVGSLLGVEAGQDAVLRTLLYERATEKVIPCGMTVASFTDKISELRNKLGNTGQKDQGIIVPANLGDEGKIPGNLLVGDKNSLSYGRKPKEILRIVYGNGNEHVPGGFYPKGANGTIARKYLKSKNTLDDRPFI